MAVRGKALLKGGIARRPVAGAGAFPPVETLEGGIVRRPTAGASPFPPVETLEDGRAAGIIQADREAAERRERARAVLAEAGASLDEERFEQVVASLRRLGSRIRDMRAWIVETGKELLKLEGLAGPGGYRALLRAGLVDLRETRASELKTIARRVTQGGLGQHLLPAAVRPAYELAKLEPPVLEAVAERIQLGPDTTIREIRQAAAAIRAEAETWQPDSHATDPDRLQAHIRDLEKQRDAAMQQVRRLQEQIAAARTRLEALNPKRGARGRAA